MVFIQLTDNEKNTTPFTQVQAYSSILCESMSANWWKIDTKVFYFISLTVVCVCVCLCVYVHTQVFEVRGSSEGPPWDGLDEIFT